MKIRNLLFFFLPPLLAAPVSAETLTTTFAGGNGNSGIMFDVVADKPLSITAIQFASTSASAGSLEIYVKAGTHVGSEGTAGAWNLLVTAPFAAGPTNTAKAPILLPGSIPVQPGEPLAFYLRQVANSLSYTNGDGVGTVEADDGTLRILEGTAVDGLFGVTIAERIPNVTIHYSRTPDVLTTTFVGGASNPGIVFDVVAKNALNLRSLQFPVNNAGTHSVRVYTRFGSHVGVEADSSAWTFVGIRPVTVAGAQTTMTFDLPEALPLPTGGTRAFMIAVTSPGVVVYSSGGPEAVGNVEAEDSNLRILKGIRMSGLFVPIASPRVPNVAIHYSDADRLAPKITIVGPRRIKAAGVRARIYGVARDDVALDRVDARYKMVKGIKPGPLVKRKLPLQPSGLFLLNLKLAQGRNVATFQATDRSGRKSALARVTVVR